ncbi:MAG TPA: ACP phosphodiesterase [Puia sp.]|nr:ACP phosphodiesterase [Puia sp.]
MNYLAHAYLSFDIPDILVGNLISDFVKGKRKFDYPVAIQTGIALHRAIDAFTDAHPATRRAKFYFRPDYGLYSGPLTDVAYDHFLANDPLIFPSSAALSAFAARAYTQLSTRAGVFPDRFSRLFPFMRDYDWFSGYRTKEGILASFNGLARRAAYMPPPDNAGRVFEVHYQDIMECYTSFFPELKAFAFHTLRELDPNQNLPSGKFG